MKNNVELLSAVVEGFDTCQTYLITQILSETSIVTASKTPADIANTGLAYPLCVIFYDEVTVNNSAFDDLDTARFIITIQQRGSDMTVNNPELKEVLDILEDKTLNGYSLNLKVNGWAHDYTGSLKDKSSRVITTVEVIIQN